MKNGNSIKILAVSDTVEPLLKQPSGDGPLADIDVIISCGDLPPEYLSVLVHVFNVPLYYVCGNHDIRYKNKPPEGGFNLHCRLVTVEGINMVGLEGRTGTMGDRISTPSIK